MRKKNDLFEELGIRQRELHSCNALDADVRAIKQKVHSQLASVQEERESMMKSKKKVSLIVLAATFVLGVTVFAASGMISSWSSSSSSVPDYKTFPTLSQVTKDIGYSPVLVERFENGYAFADGSVVTNNLTDENGDLAETFKSVSFDYEKDGDLVVFTQEKFQSQIDMPGEVIARINDTDLCYYQYVNVSVPADYELTDEEKAAEENGTLVFSYGSPEVMRQNIQLLSWQKDGLRFQLMQMNGKLSGDELAKMAKEILSQSKPK